MNNKNKGMTLIEMLIVVAIMGIMAAGLVAFITVPPREQAQASTDLEIEQGLGGFFAKVVGDAHNATSLTLARGGRALIFDSAGPKDGSAGFSPYSVYYIDRKDCLRRAAAPSTEWVEAGAEPTSITAALLARGVRGLAARPLQEEGLWRIEVNLATGDEFRPKLERGLDVRLGMKWPMK